ncbi:MAG: hypothetical protein DRR03_02240 [Gammaproteobacteria bacterium]|nr:MAG: hypothetical protein DRR03_02240 [Gammaproteobacteria bacterium]
MTEPKNEEGDHEEYRGPERRNGIERRVKADQRQELRFEPKKSDRRQKARRKADGDAWADHDFF